MMSSVRTFLERAVRGRTFVRRLPADLSRLPVVVTPDAQLKYLRPGKAGFDGGLLDAARRLVRPGDNVWDVGANVGVFTLAAAALSGTGRIVAVEADIWLTSLIRRTARLQENVDFDIHVVPAAAASEAGIEMFSIAARGRASNHLASVAGNTQAGGEREQVPVPCIALDCLLEPFGAPNVVKMDVEGAEVHALKGMRRVLSEIRPSVYVEIASANQEAVRSLMQKHRYRSIDLITHLPTKVHSFNALFIPSDAPDT